MRKVTNSLENKLWVMEMAERKIWVDGSGRERPISGMDTNHIRNCMRLLERKKTPGGPILIAAFQEELDRRGADAPASMELEDRYRRLCNITRDLFRYYRIHEPVRAKRYETLLEGIGVDV